MDENKKQLLQQWLEIEFYSIANKSKLISKRAKVDKKLVYDSIRCLDFMTTMEKTPSINYIITLIALMWEYTDKDVFDLRRVIVKFLSRIGYPASAIIVDDKFDKDNCRFLPLNSYIEEITATLNQEHNEIEINGYKFLLTSFQKEIWDCMEEDKVIGISAPTSAGKSFVILLKILKKISTEDMDIVYIVPTLSLLNQVTEDFNSELKRLKIREYRISNSFEAENKTSKKNIYVLTQEKAIMAFANEETAFQNRMILVADEIQNIERIRENGDERSKILFDTLMEFRYKENVEQIIIAGPRIEEINKIGENIFGIETRDLTTEVSPVLNLTYSISRVGKKYYLKLYCALLDNPIVAQIENYSIITGYGQKLYTDKYLEYFSGFVKEAGAREQNIIFAPTASSARKIACHLGTQVEEKNDIFELVKYYESTIHKNYALCETLKHDVAYHHGKLPMHVRRTLEKAIAEKKISNVVCTTTLMQGVNMPAQNVFIRNPHLYLRKRDGSAELSNYEMANLRGRAGRLLKDFIGRTFVMDESEFADTDGYEQMDLFDDVTKELPSSYEEKFEEYREDIENIIDSKKPVDATMRKYGYLVSYIRQSVLRYGSTSKQRMENVGIKLTQKQVAAIIRKLDALTVPKDVCIKNRYWDPFILEKIYTDYSEKVPTTPMERGAKAKLDRMMKFIRDTEETADMYNKYIPEEYRKGSKRTLLCNLSMKWANEVPLVEILNDDKYSGEDGADEIDNTIELLQSTSSYNVPLLLKPIFDMKNPDSIFLTCMQAGAINTITRNLIEMGIPRETALFLHKKLFKADCLGKKDKVEIEQIIRERLKEKYDEMPYWIRIQLDFLV